MQEILTIITTILNKVYLIMFLFSCLYTLRQTGLFLMSLRQGEKYVTDSKKLIYLGLSIAIIFTIIFSGIKLF
jgi:hypothetical protein